MATTTTGGPAQVVTVYASADATTSSTMSLVYIYSAATTEAQPTSTSSSSSHNLAGGAIAGIIVGCVTFLLLLAVGLFCYSRKIARKRRSERAPSTVQFPASSSRHTLPSRAQSRASTAINSPTMQQVGGRGVGGSGSVGGGSSSRNQQYARSSPRTPKSARHRPKTPPHELPTYPDRPELEGSGGPPSPRVHEVYGSYVHPVELQAGSMTNLVAEVAQIRKAKVTEKTVTTSITRGENDYSDSGSTGYLSPTWPPPSRGGAASEMDVTDSSTIVTHDGDFGYGGGDRSVQSIHVYFSPGSEYGGSAAAAADPSSAAALSRRQSQIAIAKAMSAASSSPSKASRSTMRSSSATNVTR